LGESSAKLRVKPSASIDSVGIWTSLATGSVRDLDYKLVKENNQWRISEAPNVTVLVKPVFDVLFRSYSLYFFDGENRYLVPDLRWFPSRVSTGTRLVNALIAGPNKWIADAVSNSFPEGTKLAIDAVTVDKGTALVDLNATANKADKLQRARMLSQLSATLNQLPSIYSVKVQIDHTPQDIPMINAELPYASSVSMLVLDSSGIRNIASNTINEKATAAANRVNATDFGFSPSMSNLALLSKTGISLLKLNNLSSKLSVIDTRPNLLAPSVDNREQIWTLGKEADSELVAYDENGKRLFGTSSWLASGKHLAFGISREGSRLAVLIKGKKANFAYVATISRDENGKPIGLLNPRRVAIELPSLISLSWSGANTLVGLFATEQNMTTPVTIYVGGGHEAMTPILGGKKVISQVDASNTYVLDDMNLLFEYHSMNWNVVDSTVKAAHYTGY
jgi:hypothetical protein